MGKLLKSRVLAHEVESRSDQMIMEEPLQARVSQQRQQRPSMTFVPVTQVQTQQPQNASKKRINQVDGEGDSDEDDDEDEDLNEEQVDKLLGLGGNKGKQPMQPAAVQQQPLAEQSQPKKPEETNDDELLGSDLDDSDTDVIVGTSSKPSANGNSSKTKLAEDQQENGLILCQYEKVTRSRKRWKAILKDGVMNLNGRDYAFSRAQCEFEF